MISIDFQNKQNKRSNKFSVIIISYNNLNYIFDCLDSVLSQKYDNFEIIVSDDSSVNYDESSLVDYIMQNKEDNLSKVIVYTNETNMGTVRNINKAIGFCSGEYIKIIACDDALFDVNVLSKASIVLEKSHFGIISSNVYKCNSADLAIVEEYKNSFIKKSSKKSSLFFLKANCKRNRIIAPSIFFKKTFFIKYGLFDEDCILIEDWSKWLQLFIEGAIIEYFDFNSVKYRFDVGVGRSTNKVLIRDKKTIFRKYIKTNKKIIGFWCYFISKLSFLFRTSIFVRKVYSFLKR